MKALIELILLLFSKKGRERKRVVKREASVNSALIESREKEEDSNDPIAYKNSRKRLQDEHKTLINENIALYNVLAEIDTYVWDKYQKNVIITMIYRTQAEQDYLYRNSDKYAKKKFKSPHQFWHGVDIRSRVFTRAEIKDIVAWVNRRYNRENYYKWTAKCHDIGSGMHFHIQFVRP